MLAATAELTGGLLVVTGLAMPVAAVLITAVMAAAIAGVHWRSGLWVTNNGFEYPLVLTTVAFTLAAIGPGGWSLDRALGIEWHGAAPSRNRRPARFMAVAPCRVPAGNPGALLAVAARTGP